MANPNPAYAGTATALYITGAGSANLANDITNYCSEIVPTYNGQRLDTTTMGNTSRQFIRGFLENGYQVRGVWDTTIDGIMMGLMTAGTAGPIRYAPSGSASGLVKHDGTATLISYSPPSNVNEAVTWSAEFAVNGSVTRSTF